MIIKFSGSDRIKETKIDNYTYIDLTCNENKNSNAEVELLEITATNTTNNGLLFLKYYNVGGEEMIVKTEPGETKVIRDYIVNSIASLDAPNIAHISPQYLMMLK